MSQPAAQESLAPLPYIALAPGETAFHLLQKKLPEAQALLETCLSAHGLKYLAPYGDYFSKKRLQQWETPFMAELTAMASLLQGQARAQHARQTAKGIFFLNLIYEWACTAAALPDPQGPGPRLMRILDWDFPGLGEHLMLVRFETPQGPYYSATWPGYAGVLTAMAPGRFAIALNQAPSPDCARYPLGQLAGVMRLHYQHRPHWPAVHLLRKICEEAKDYDAALALLKSDRYCLAAPFLGTLTGVAAHETALIEAKGTDRLVTHGGAAGLSVGNEWVSAPWPGVGRGQHWGASSKDRWGESALRRAQILDCARQPHVDPFAFPSPLLNYRSRLFFMANAATGALTVQGLRKATPAEQETTGCAAVAATQKYSLA